MLSDLPPEVRAMNNIERRRKLEEERKQRIFNPRVRTKGIDVAAIDQQVEMKRKQKEEERNLEIYWARNQELLDRQLYAVEQAKAAERSALAREVDSYRKESQQPDMAREYDLNDPMYLKKDRPAREGDDDPRLHVSGGQQFAGEDLTKADRVERQRAQQREWAAQQVAEREAAIAEERKREADLDAYLLRVDAQVQESARQQERARREGTESTKDLNARQAAEKAAHDAAVAAEEQAQKDAELHGQATDPWLNEDRRTTVRPSEEGRFIPYNFKGLSVEQREEIMREVEAQVKDKADAKARAAAEEAAWHKHNEQLARALRVAEAKAKREKRDKEKAYQAELLRQKEEHEASVKKQNETFANAADPYYFAQFGTTTR